MASSPHRVRPRKKDNILTYCAYDMQDMQRNLASSNNYIIRGSRQWGDWWGAPIEKGHGCSLYPAVASWRFSPLGEFAPPSSPEKKKTTSCARRSNHTKQVYSSFFNPLKATGEFEVESVKGVHGGELGIVRLTNMLTLCNMQAHPCRDFFSLE